MAFDPVPSTWFSGITQTSTGITIPYTALNELNQTKATNDVREILFNFCEAFFDTWDATASEDRPAEMTCIRSASLRQTTTDDIITKQYTIRVNVVPDSLDVVSE